MHYARDSWAARTALTFHPRTFHQSPAASTPPADAALASAMGPDEMAQIDHSDNGAPLGKAIFRVGDVVLLLKTLDKVAGLDGSSRMHACAL